MDLKTVAVRKDSFMGRLFLKNTDFKEEDAISYEDIKNALLIAIFKGENRMSNKISPLFEKEIYGTKEEKDLVTGENLKLTYRKISNKIEE